MRSKTGLPRSVIVALAILLLAILFLILTVNRNPLHIYLLPENFVGQVQTIFEQPDAPPLAKENNNTYIYHVPASGTLKTSSRMESGPVEVYYIDSQGNRRKVEHERFHGVSTRSGGPDNITVSEFFIGSEEQYDSFRNSNK
ncbi:DUF6843 domain-containing protein [Paenibacillus silviterrae]|uniref:DUF6843 domain-containing protein n=1 Tax=Paenibacillus silviterrae TaxID=3242194 RepID=UPI0025432DF6|nr:hypothetical protein [Paenibacillus chinjuensis]